ncbi:MAG: hypothetical protein ACON5A_02660 [Candidatus Comchoanobacterales bacterium]
MKQAVHSKTMLFNFGSWLSSFNPSIITEPKISNVLKNAQSAYSQLSQDSHDSQLNLDIQRAIHAIENDSNHFLMNPLFVRCLARLLWEQNNTRESFDDWFSDPKHEVLYTTSFWAFCNQLSHGQTYPDCAFKVLEIVDDLKKTMDDHASDGISDIWETHNNAGKTKPVFRFFIEWRLQALYEKLDLLSNCDFRGLSFGDHLFLKQMVINDSFVERKKHGLLDIKGYEPVMPLMYGVLQLDDQALCRRFFDLLCDYKKALKFFFVNTKKIPYPPGVEQWFSNLMEEFARRITLKPTYRSLLYDTICELSDRSRFIFFDEFQYDKGIPLLKLRFRWRQFFENVIIWWLLLSFIGVGIGIFSEMNSLTLWMGVAWVMANSIVWIQTEPETFSTSYLDHSRSVIQPQLVGFSPHQVKITEVENECRKDVTNHKGYEGYDTQYYGIYG